MKAPSTIFIVTGVAPARSVLDGQTVQLGTFRGRERAEECKAFFSLHYDNITIHAGQAER